MKNKLNPSGVFDGVEVFWIPGWEGYFSVSKNGEIWSHARTINRSSSKMTLKGKWLKPWIHNCGYPQAGLHRNGKTTVILIHRIMAEVFLGASGKYSVDHIDGITSNNNLSNLRLATHSENMANSKTRSDNSSGRKGVSFDRGKWHAYINFNGKRKNLGRFPRKSEAILQRENAEIEIHQDFRSTSVIRGVG